MKRIFLVGIILLTSCISWCQNGHSDKILSLAFNQQNNQLLSSGQDGLVILWDEMGNPTRIFTPPSGEYKEMHRIFFKVSFFKDQSNFIAAGLLESYIGNTSNSTLSPMNMGMLGGDQALDVSTKSDYILTANGIDKISIRIGAGIDQGKIINQISEVAASAIYSIDNTNQFLVYSYVNGIKIMDIDGNTIHHFPNLKQRQKIKIAPNGKTFVLENAIYSIQGKKIRELKLTNAINAIAYSANSQNIFFANGARVDVFTIEGKLIATTKHTESIHSVTPTSDGTRFVCGDSKGNIEMWTVSGRKVQEYK